MSFLREESRVKSIPFRKGKEEWSCDVLVTALWSIYFYGLSSPWKKVWGKFIWVRGGKNRPALTFWEQKLCSTKQLFCPEVLSWSIEIYDSRIHVSSPPLCRIQSKSKLDLKTVACYLHILHHIFLNFLQLWFFSLSQSKEATSLFQGASEKWLP